MERRTRVETASPVHFRQTQKHYIRNIIRSIASIYDKHMSFPLLNQVLNLLQSLIG
jgi:hypothetical protein